MKTGGPFEVVTTTERGSIILVSRRESSILLYFHFMGADEAAQFADTSETVLANSTYTDQERCLFCGQPVTRKGRLGLLTDTQTVHTKRFQKLAQQGSASYEDCKNGTVMSHTPKSFLRSTIPTLMRQDKNAGFDMLSRPFPRL